MTSRDTPQIAVWLFVSATFVFASTTLFFPDAGLWGRVITLALGLLLVVTGGFRLAVEMKARRRDTE